MRSGSFLSRETSTEETCAYVDNMIHAIQTQIKRELGFKEIVVATGDEVLDNGGSNASSSAATVDSSNGGGIPIPSASTTACANNVVGSATNSTPSGESPQSSYSDDVRQVVGDELWDSMKSSRRGYLYGLKPKSYESNGSAASCPDCAKGTVYVSPYYKSKKRVLVIVPYREAGIWSRSICMQQTSANDNSGAMLSYLKKALAENYGVVIMNPAAQVCHPSAHVEQAWDQLIAPLDSDIFIIAFSRGCQYVKHLLNHDNGQGIVQDRVKALALVEPSHYVNESDTYFARRILARRAVAWILSTEIDVGSKIPKGEARHGCVCISAGVVPMNVQGSSGAWALEIVMSSVFGSFAARCGEASGITVNDTKISSCGICHRKLGVLNRRIPCSWCEVKHCSKCCEDKFVPSFGSWRVCSLCQSLPCLIDPRRKNKSAKTHKSPTNAGSEERLSVFIKPQGDEPVSLRDFEIIKLIGRGACGRVKLVRKNHGSDEGSFYAMKAIRKKLVIQRGLVEATNAERRILDRTNHTYVAALCYAFQSESKLYLLSKYCPGGNLLDQMRLARRFTEDRTRLYTAEVALAIRHLHENNIIYRDLKLENVLVDSDGHVALTDFGMSKENMAEDSRTSTFVGTYQMMAPEVFSGKAYSRAVDWWALGVMVYEMIDGRTPFNAKTNKLIKERIVNVDLKFSPRFTEDAKDFVSKLLTRSEEDRLGCGENGFEHIKNHPWFGGLDWDKVALRQETFEGQAELMKSHAKEYKTSDIFDTYMNTIEVPVDTPASMKSSTSELFGDFAFNFMDESSVGDEPEFEEPGDDHEEDNAEDTEDRDDVSPEVAAPSTTDAEIETFLVSADSQFDISLLRPDRATDFGLSVSSASLSSSGSGDEVVTVVETVADPALTTVGSFTKLATAESPTESSSVSPVKASDDGIEVSQP